MLVSNTLALSKWLLWMLSHKSGKRRLHGPPHIEWTRMFWVLLVASNRKPRSALPYEVVPLTGPLTSMFLPCKKDMTRIFFRLVAVDDVDVESDVGSSTSTSSSCLPSLLSSSTWTLVDELTFPSLLALPPSPPPDDANRLATRLTCNPSSRVGTNFNACKAGRVGSMSANVGKR